MREWETESDREDTAALALLALAGGAGEECGGCGAEVERDGSGWACPNGCFRALCPVCGADLSDFNACEHLLAAPDNDTGGWFYSPFERVDVPQMAEACEEDDDVVDFEREEELFGAASPLLGAYDSGYSAPPYELDLWERILGALRVPVLEESWASPMYYTPRPRAALAQINSLMGGLAEGFRRLADLRDARPAERDAADDDTASVAR